jgi:hypothetical protein
LSRVWTEGSDKCGPRLALGSSTYTSIRAALTDRLAVLDAPKDIALSTDSNE